MHKRNVLKLCQIRKVGKVLVTFDVPFNNYYFFFKFSAEKFILLWVLYEEH